jgi:hypothetical protein
MPDGSYKRYLFEYRYDDAEWCLEIPARSEAEARERLKVLPWAHYRGEAVMTVRIPHTPVSGLSDRIRACIGSVARAIGVRRT